jgi:archaeal cell division control protein 6
MPNFSDILSHPSIFANRNVLSPHYIPDMLPFREKEIEKVMVTVAPALADGRARNLFIYGKTGTGKTCTVRHVMGKFSSHEGALSGKGRWAYVNCRMYNSRYRAIQKIAKDFLPELDKSGFGINTLYEKFFEYVQEKKMRMILVLDEVDMVRDLDELLYTLTRMNDELTAGSVSVIGITNRLSFKDELDQRSKSSLCETEIVFAPYTPPQLAAILMQRSVEGFKVGGADESALNLAAAIAAQETGDARYALKLLLKAGEYADEHNLVRISDKEVEQARRTVDADLATEAIITLPSHQQLVLLGVCNLTLEGRKYQKLTSKQSSLNGNAGRELDFSASSSNDENDPYLLSGEVYEEYARLCRTHRKPKRSARWYREYLNDLEMLGLIVTVESGRGMRGHTRLIKAGYPPEQMRLAIEKGISIVEGKEDAGASGSTILPTANQGDS